jgi:hypothetical protein
VGAASISGPTSDNVLGVALSVPLFVRNTYRAEVVAAQADADAAEAEQRRVELELQARAERTTRTYEAVRAAWEQWSKSTGTDVDKRADLLERLWRAGEISTADYLIQLKQSLDTALAGADLHGRLWRSYIDALYATGRLDAWVGFDAPNEEGHPMTLFSRAALLRTGPCWPRSRCSARAPTRTSLPRNRRRDPARRQGRRRSTKVRTRDGEAHGEGRSTPKPKARRRFAWTKPPQGRRHRHRARRGLGAQRRTACSRRSRRQRLRHHADHAARRRAGGSPPRQARRRGAARARRW